MLQITGEETIRTLDISICKTVRGLEYWGQLNVSKEQFDILRGYVLDYKKKRKNIKSVSSDYPYVFMTYAVFLAKYHYNGDFWGLLSTDMGIEGKISQSEQSFISQNFLKVLN